MTTLTGEKMRPSASRMANLEMTGLLRHLRDSSRGLRPAFRERSEFHSIETYCGFLGHGRSGHSLIGALINAHPEAVIAHELHALRYLLYPIPRDVLYGLIVERDRWFSAKGESWAGYNYRVEDQWQGRWETLKLIGDKKGGQSTSLLTDHPHVLERLRKTVGVPVRFLWVIRNPYDNIATKYLRPIKRTMDEWTELYFRNLETAERLVRQELDSDEVMVFRIEDFIESPRAGIRRVCDFLRLDASPEYVEACGSKVFSNPSRTRDKIEWRPTVLERVQEGIERSSYLSGYKFEE